MNNEVRSVQALQCDLRSVKREVKRQERGERIIN